MISDEYLTMKFRSRSRKQFKTTLEFIQKVAFYEESGQSELKAIWNSASHVNLLSHDLFTYLYFSTIANDKWADGVGARSIATLIYEGLDDLPALMGKPLKEACEGLGIYEDFKPELKRLRKQLADFKGKYNDVLQPVRMAAHAHRDHDLLVFIENVLNASPNKFIQIGKEFECILCEIGKFNQDVINRASLVQNSKG